jgi:hypothetical protein
MFGQIGERNSAIVADFEEHEAARDHRNPTMTDIPPFRLGGEIDPNDWNFSRLGEAGPLPNPIGHTFPPPTTLISAGSTGFYINDGGFFATARHVIEDILKDGRQVSPSPGQDDRCAGHWQANQNATGYSPRPRCGARLYSWQALCVLRPWPARLMCDIVTARASPLSTHLC